MLKVLFFGMLLIFNLKASSQYDLPVGDEYIKSVQNYKKFQKEAFDKKDFVNFKKYTEELTDLLTLKKYDKIKYSFRIANDKEKKDIYEAIFQSRKINKDLNLYEKYTQDNARNLSIILKIDSLAKDFYSNHDDDKKLSDWVRELITKNTYKDLSLKELDILSTLYNNLDPKTIKNNLNDKAFFDSVNQSIDTLNTQGKDVHNFDSFLNQNINKYCDYLGKIFADTAPKTLTPDEFFKNLEFNNESYEAWDQKLNREGAMELAKKSINHMFSLQDNGRVLTLLKLTQGAFIYARSSKTKDIADDYSNMLLTQILDAQDGLCMEGQRNRLFLVLNAILNSL
jgi:hypothetical protein